MAPVLIAVHGGAWAIPDSLVEATRRGMKMAVRLGYEMLDAGGSALDAVQAAVMCLEDNPAFNAGRGSTLNRNGEVEMDALVMEGQGLRAGSVACVSNVEHPIALARLVMDQTEHTMLVGKGADEFAVEMQLPLTTSGRLVTPEAEAELEHFRRTNYTGAVDELFTCKVANGCEEESNPGHDTVGAVALDDLGNVACATSTGGISTKRSGRVGDSPIIGCGGYADNEVGAVSSTGHGESISRVCLAHSIITMMKYGSSVEKAANEGLQQMLNRVGGHGGVIVLDREGHVTHACTTPRMAWALMSSQSPGIVRHGIEPYEDIAEDAAAAPSDASVHGRPQLGTRGGTCPPLENKIVCKKTKMNHQITDLSC